MKHSQIFTDSIIYINNHASGNTAEYSIKIIKNKVMQNLKESVVHIKYI